MATQLFAAKITRARFVMSPFSSEQMLAIGQVAANSIKTRILGGQNAADQKAKPLSMKYRKRPDKKGRITYGADTGYRAFKLKRGRAPIRDWFLSGDTLDALRVKSASENRVVVGFINEKSDRIAHTNNLREKAFGLSPNDMKAVHAAIAATFKSMIRFRRVAA